MEEENKSSKAEELDAQDVQAAPRKVNILQIAPWLAAATVNNKSFLLKPNDLRMLYMFVLWEYLSKHHHPGVEIDKVEAIANDEQISIPEADLVRMVRLVFHNTYYPYLSRVYNM